MMAAMLISMMAVAGTSAVAAESPAIDLRIEEGYATPFSVKDIKPGDLGTKSVVLRNIGTSNGEIAIWITGIVESDHANDGAHLDDYLLFEVEAEGLLTNIDMPCTIRSLPSSGFGDGYIWVLNVRSGEAIQVTWYWEFLETYSPQNEAQGDSLGFTINYLLGDMPPPRPGMSWMQVTVVDKSTNVLLDPDGRAAGTFEAESQDHTVALLLEEGTMLTSAGEMLTTISVQKASSRATLPDGQAMIGSPLEVRASTANGSVDGRISDSNFTLRVNYDPALLPTVTRLVGLYLHEDGSWTALPSALELITYIGQCSALMDMTGEVAVIATYDPQEAAYFLPSDLEIQPSEHIYWGPIEFVSRIGESVLVSVALTNVGEVPGVKNITLAINGQAVESAQVALAPSESTQVTFVVQGLEQGSYDVSVAGLTGEVQVGTDVNWWLILAFACFGFVSVTAFAYSTKRWRDMRKRMIWLQGNMMNVEAKMLQSEMALVSMKEKQKVSSTEAKPVDSGAPASASPQAEGASAPTLMVEAAAVQPAAARPETEVSVLETPPTPVPPVPAPLIVAPVEIRPSAAEPPVLDELQRQQDQSAKKIRIAKDFILSTLEQKGQISIDSLPRSKNAEIAMAAFTQLIDEGKIKAVQKEHSVVFMLVDR